MLKFEKLRIGGWRQFSQVEIEFSPQLTVITGANGAGKSTILNLLIQHFGLSRTMLGVPTTGSGARGFLVNVFNVFSAVSRLAQWMQPQVDQSHTVIGSIAYSNEGATQLLVPTQGQQTYNVQFPQAQGVIGFHMPSHRALPTYQPIPNVPFGGIDPEQAFDRLYPEYVAIFSGSHTGQSVLFKLKELLAAWASYGPGNDLLGSNVSQADAFAGFVEVLRKVFPPDLGFESLAIVPPDIVVKTTSGDFLADSLSGGLLSLLEMAALIYARTLRPDGAEGFVVTIDEPENHLHPAMQRGVLPALMRAFPAVQFIVATHSPFIVTSAPEAAVYALRYEDVEIQSAVPDEVMPDQSGRRVVCTRLDLKSLSSSTTDILRDVLGVDFTYPVWVERKLDEIVDRFREKDFTKETIEEFRTEVAGAGLSEAFPTALLELGRSHD
jgi:hypothetical protein